jgi:hypothetical protein
MKTTKLRQGLQKMILKYPSKATSIKIPFEILPENLE